MSKKTDTYILFWGSGEVVVVVAAARGAAEE